MANVSGLFGGGAFSGHPLTLPNSGCFRCPIVFNLCSCVGQPWHRVEHFQGFAAAVLPHSSACQGAIEVPLRSTAAAAATGLPSLLDGRARYRRVGAEDAAVPGLRLEHRVALLAFVEPLAGVRGHGLRLDVAARRASQRGFEDDGSHYFSSTSVDG